jgi:uncharacterized repeat protein (TIGR02543 family)
MNGPDGSTITLPAGPTRTGYTFAGWFAGASGGSALSSPYTLAGSITLYAQWTINSFTVTFDNNGGTGSMSNESASYNVAMALTTNTFTKTGYTFSGWNNAANGTGTPYADGASYPFTSSVTLYAQWTVIGTDVITFNTQGGSAVGSMNGPDGSTITLPAGPTRTGYTFAGWFAGASGGSALSSPYTLTSSITLYAQWAVNGTDMITFNSNGGSSVSSMSGLDGTTITLPAGPTRTGYTFAYWFTVANGGSALSSPYILTSSTTLYAQWTANSIDTVAFTSSPPTNPQIGGQYALGATSTSGGAVTFSLANSSTGCSLNGITITFVSIGKCTVNGSTTANNTYLAGSASQSFTIGGLIAQTVGFTTTPPSVALIGDSYTFAAVASGGVQIIFVLYGSTSACTLNGQTVSFVAAGTCEIYAIASSNSTYNSAVSSQAITVSALKMQSIIFTSPPLAKAYVGTSYTLSASATSGSVTFSLGSSTGCALNGATLTFLGVGTCTVDATATATTIYAAARVSEIFVVSVGTIASPTGIIAIAGDRLAVVSWLAPTNSSSFGAIIYTVTSSGGASCSVAGVTSCLITGLNNGSTYTFTVIATTTSPSLVSSPSPASLPIKPSSVSAPPTPGGTTAELRPGTGQVTNSNGTTTPFTILVAGNFATISTGGASIMIRGGSSTTLSNGSSVVVMFGGSSTYFAGSGFLPGSNVDIYLFPKGTRLGTAVVRANGTYSVTVRVPASLASGNHTALVQGFITATSRTSFSMGVIVKAGVTSSVAVSQFVSGSAKLTAPMQGTLAKLAASMVRHVATSFRITGFNGNATSKVASLILSRSRAIAVMTFLRSQLMALHFHKTVIMHFVIIRGRIQGVSVTIV